MNENVLSMKIVDQRTKKKKATFCLWVLFTHFYKVLHFSLLAACFMREDQVSAEELQQL